MLRNLILDEVPGRTLRKCKARRRRSACSRCVALRVVIGFGAMAWCLFRSSIQNRPSPRVGSASTTLSIKKFANSSNEVPKARGLGKQMDVSSDRCSRPLSSFIELHSAYSGHMYGGGRLSAIRFILTLVSFDQFLNLTKCALDLTWVSSLHLMISYHSGFEPFQTM